MHTSSQLTLLTRIGFASRGVLYIVIAYLILRARRAEDQSGALEYLGNGSGKLLLCVMAVGFVAYGLWRLSDAIFNIERHASDGKGAAERVAAGLSGLVHLFLTWQAVALIRGISSSGDGAQDGARSALELPGGPALVILAGVVLAATGVWQLVKAAKAGFLRHLEPGMADKTWVKWSGRAGYAARGLVFLITSGFLIKAGWEARAREAGGMADAITWLPEPFDIVIAVGLLGFGLFSLIEARFRILHDVPVEGIAQRVTGGRFS
ncbi:DUF1206 domain-containing protein [Sphingomonas tagetis]|nr:DUF1206 domain-containing protein [Sphingomonas tagetis]